MAPVDLEGLSDPVGQVLLRLAQIRAYAVDAAATSDEERRQRKHALVGRLVDASMDTGRAATSPPWTLLAELSHRDTAETAEALGRRLAPGLAKAAVTPFLVELASSTDWPEKRLDFALDRHVVLAETATTMIGRRVATHEVAAISSAFKSAKKRLIGDSASYEKQATLGVITLAAAALGGVGAEQLGNFIGTQMGLSGAAATSAGLAWLGGGSLAAGGAGMAGGFLVVQHVVHGARIGVNFAIKLATSSSTTFINELAKLHVLMERGGITHADLKDRLSALEGQLWAARDGVSGKAAKELGRSTRAVEYELRYLRSERWERNVGTVARKLGFPVASRLLDLRRKP